MGEGCVYVLPQGKDNPPPQPRHPTPHPSASPYLQVLLRGLEGQVELEHNKAQLARLHSTKVAPGSETGTALARRAARKRDAPGQLVQGPFVSRAPRPHGLWFPLPPTHPPKHTHTTTHTHTAPNKAGPKPCLVQRLQGGVEAPPAGGLHARGHGRQPQVGLRGGSLAGRQQRLGLGRQGRHLRGVVRPGMRRVLQQLNTQC